MNPRRPHTFQISDSEFSVINYGGTWGVQETWWRLDKRLEKEDCCEVVASFPTEAEAIAERDRRAGKCDG